MGVFQKCTRQKCTGNQSAPPVKMVHFCHQSAPSEKTLIMWAGHRSVLYWGTCPPYIFYLNKVKKCEYLCCAPEWMSIGLCLFLSEAGQSRILELPFIHSPVIHVEIGFLYHRCLVMAKKVAHAFEVGIIRAMHTQVISIFGFNSLISNGIALRLFQIEILFLIRL